MSFGYVAPIHAPLTPSFSTAASGAGANPSPFSSFGNASAAAPAAGGFGGFGASTAAKPTTGLFGSTAAQPGAQQTTGLFGSTSAAQPAATSSLFGARPGTPAGGSSLFGTSANTGTTGATGGLFGQPAAAGTTGQTGGGLFGQNAGASTTGGGLFGQQNANAGTSGTAGLFGQPAAAGAGGGLFGQQNAGAANTGAGLFGQSTSQPQASTGLFGSQPAAAAGGSSLFGAPKPANSLQASTGQQGGGISKTTKFSDLPEQVQKGIEQMDNFIKDQKQIGASLNTENIGRAIWQTSGDVKAACDEQAAIAQGLLSLQNSLEQLALKVVSEAQDLTKILETYEASKPQEKRLNHVRPVAHRDVPQEYFFRLARSLEERVNRYKRTIALLTRAIMSLANDHESLSPQVITQTIQNNQQAILALAAQLEGLQLRMNVLRALFTDEYRERTNSMRDPFDVAREEKRTSLLRA